MRVWILLAGLCAVPALADDSAERNAIGKTSGKHVEFGSQDHKHFGFRRGGALYASPRRLELLPASIDGPPADGRDHVQDYNTLDEPKAGDL